MFCLLNGILLAALFAIVGVKLNRADARAWSSERDYLRLATMTVSEVIEADIEEQFEEATK